MENWKNWYTCHNLRGSLILNIHTRCANYTSRYMAFVNHQEYGMKNLVTFFHQLIFIAGARIRYYFLIERMSTCFIYMLVYVDDIIVTGTSDEVVQSLITKLSSRFKLKDIGHLQFFSRDGTTRMKDSGYFALSQQRYISDLLTRTNICKIPNVLQFRHQNWVLCMGNHFLINYYKNLHLEHCYIHEAGYIICGEQTLSIFTTTNDYVLGCS